MQNKRLIIFAVLVLGLVSIASTCRDRGAGSTFTIAMDGKFSTLDPIGATTVDANSERLRTLMYNSLVKKNEKFEYVGDLAKEIKTSEDGLTYTFVLNDNVKFHDGQALTSADVKYTLDTLLASKGGKSASLLETIDGKTSPIISGVEAPDEKTISVKIVRADLKNQLLPNLMPIAIIPKDAKVGEGTDAATKPPVGTGAYRFKSFDTAQQIVELEAFDGAWEGPPNIKNIRVKILADANALQAELLAGRVDLAPNATNLTPDTLKSLGESPNLKVEDFKGSNIQYLWFNVESKPLDNVKVRQAIAYAVNRKRIIDDLLNGKATLAYSILPSESWAYSDGVKYDFDLEKAKSLLDEAGFKDKGGDGMRKMDKIVFKIGSGNKATSEYVQVIQSQLKEIGIPVGIESLERSTMFEQVKLGNFGMTTGIWVGGNQDPIFFNDLFHSSKIPTKDNKDVRNRGRYANKEVDASIEKAMTELDQQKAKEDYAKTWELISTDMPFLPLWYTNNFVVAAKKVGNIKMNASGDWDFVRKLTVE